MICVCLMFSLCRTSTAASFDCGKANNAREKMICANPALSAADTKLGGLYTAALQRLSERGRHQLRDDQRVWLHYLSDACPISADADAGTADPAESCMQSAYSDRTRDFAQIAIRKGPFLFTGVYRYSVTRLEAKQGPYDTGLAKHELSYPRIDSPVNPMTTKWNRKQIGKGGPYEYCDGNDGDTSAIYNLGLANARLISATKGFWIYCHGAPHGFGNSHVETTVLFPSPHSLQPNDIFRTDAPWRERLNDIALASIRKASVDYSLEHLSTTRVASYVADPTNWTLRQDGLALIGASYEFGAGPLDVTIPWSELRDVMVQNPPVP
jgi:uncharacterized protein